MPIIVKRRDLKPLTSEFNAAAFMRFCDCDGCTSSAPWRVELFPGYIDYLCTRHMREWQATYAAALVNWDESSATGRPVSEVGSPAASKPERTGVPLAPSLSTKVAA